MHCSKYLTGLCLCARVLIWVCAVLCVYACDMSVFVEALAQAVLLPDGTLHLNKDGR